MKRRLALAAALAASLAMPAGASATNLFGCPDQMVPTPAALVPEGNKKDHNNNMVICAKVEDNRVVGGPDDLRDDIEI